MKKAKMKPRMDKIGARKKDNFVTFEESQRMGAENF